ncbi:peptidyl-glycine alpha-amidating monooxygenase B-like [Bradysia coprophila]|uniref:peptidyl-glycine alpha-amidating monooxygenase B-like n=1 Tax=Bradysia coprophila TaxID=38358 RepID=UPI00187D6F93|nr:peptidyl-glycine alpha-amidating monooxygenase B-like [Bradysia coprophila]
MTKFKLPAIPIVVLIILSANSSVGHRYFEFDSSWPDESVPDLQLHGTAIAPDYENNLVVLNRGSRHAIPDRNLTIDEDIVTVLDHETGKVLRTWGRNLFHHPHGIETASNGDIFITDSHLHQVFKFAYIPETKLWNNESIMTLGERLVNGSGRYHFYIPADVAIEPDTENFYVADGYGNTRVVKFDRCGNYILEFSAGSSDGSAPIPFNIVHMLTVAVRHTPTANRALRRSAANQDIVVAVADRDNFRIQYFSGNGSFLYEQTSAQLGTPNTFLMSVAHVDVNPREAPYNADVDAEFGIVYAVDLGTFAIPPVVIEIGVGWSEPSIISQFSTNISDPFLRRGAAHDIAVSKNGEEVYVVVSNSSSLIIKRFQMKVESSATRSVLMSSLFMFIMTYLSSALLTQ